MQKTLLNQKLQHSEDHKKLTFDLCSIKRLKSFCQKKKKRPKFLLNHRKPTIKYSKSIKSFVETRFKYLKVTENTQKMLNSEFKIFSSYQLTKLHPVY